MVPLPILKALAATAGTAGYLLLRRRRRTVRENMRYLRPRDSAGERERLARRLFRNMASAILDLMRLPSASREQVLALVTPLGLQNLLDALGLGKGVILVLGHLGPYELIPVWLAARGNDVSAIFEELAPEAMEAMSRYRTCTGMRILLLRSSVPGGLRALAAGGILAMAADRAVGGSRAVAMPWGAGTRPMPMGPAVFSLRSGAPIITARITRYHDGSAPYVLEFDAPIIPPAARSVDRVALMGRVSDRLQAFACEHPDEWFVFQPEWRPAEGTGVVRG